MVSNLKASEFYERLGSKDVIHVLDVRTDIENATQSLSGALHIPLDRLNNAEHTSKLNELSGELFLLCKGGKRAQMAAEILVQQLQIPLVVIDGGLDALVEMGCPVESNTSSWSLERQVRLVAGSLVAITCLLATFVNPGFIWLSIFVGLGLVFAAATDTCAMGLLLARMPWNRHQGKV